MTDKWSPNPNILEGKSKVHGFFNQKTKKPNSNEIGGKAKIDVNHFSRLFNIHYVFIAF